MKNTDPEYLNPIDKFAGRHPIITVLAIFLGAPTLSAVLNHK